MAFDGIVIAGLVHELNQTILNTKISKIAQPYYLDEGDTFRGRSGRTQTRFYCTGDEP